jgi:hypothetical protein
MSNTAQRPWWTISALRLRRESQVSIPLRSPQRLPATGCTTLCIHAKSSKRAFRRANHGPMWTPSTGRRGHARVPPPRRPQPTGEHRYRPVDDSERLRSTMSPSHQGTARLVPHVAHAATAVASVRNKTAHPAPMVRSAPRVGLRHQTASDAAVASVDRAEGPPTVQSRCNRERQGDGHARLHTFSNPSRCRRQIGLRGVARFEWAPVVVVSPVALNARSGRRAPPVASSNALWSWNIMFDTISLV